MLEHVSNGFKIAVLIYLVFFTACVKKQIDSQKGAESSDIAISDTVVNTTYETETSGTAVNLPEDKYWFTLREFGLKATLVTPEILQHYTSRIEYGESLNLIFVASKPLREFRYLYVGHDFSTETSKLIEFDELFKIDVLTPEKPFIVDWIEVGTFTNRGFSFLDSKGQIRYFWINANNADPEEGGYARILLGEKPAFKYQVGDIGPAGGWIFYDKGKYSDDWRYLEVAPADTEFETDWHTAVSRCKELMINYYTDWVLPNKEQLNIMYLQFQKNGLGDFKKEWYSSSYQDSDGFHDAYYQDFSDGSLYENYPKDIISRVRAVRIF